MFHRLFVGRLLSLLLIAGLVWGGAGLFRAGYRQGFVQGATLAAADGHAVSPPAVFGAAGWGPGPGLPPVLGLAFFAFAALMLMGALGRRRRCGGSWRAHARAGWAGGPVGPEKQPQDYV